MATVLRAGTPRSQNGEPPGSSRAVVTSASTHGSPPWYIETRPWLAERPPRKTCASTDTGPGSGERRKWALAAITCGCELTAAAARPSMASM
jgi:hypothetical protein